MDTTTPDTDLDFVVVDCTQPVDLRNCGVSTPANWAAPELRAQQAAMRKERESVFNVSAREAKALAARPIEATLFDVPAEPTRGAINTRKRRDAAHAALVKLHAKVRKAAPTLGLILK